MKFGLIFLFFFVVLFSCSNNPVTVKKPLPSIDSPKIKPTVRKYPEDTIYQNANLVIIGDSSIEKNKIRNTLAKFEPYISFDDFKVNEIFKGSKKTINYKSNPIAREYRTAITMSYKEDGLNFGGHYCFVSWGCGAPCQGSALVDLRDGKVYQGLIVPNGFDFRKNSRMLIVNPPDSSGFFEADCSYCHPEIWIWNEGAKKFKERKSIN